MSRLLLYLSHAGDPQRFAVGPALAAAADRAGWSFECYYGALRRGRHFGGGDPGRARPGWPNGSLVSGGRHLEQAFQLARRYDVVALGDPQCVLWPALDDAGAEAAARTPDPAAVYKAAFKHLGVDVPNRVLVVDAQPQGKEAIIAAPYLYPAFFVGEPALGLEASATDAVLAEFLRSQAELSGLYVGTGFRGELSDGFGTVGDATYAEFTSELAERYATWGQGVLLGDPDLVAAQLPRAHRLHLLPLYGQPQVDAIKRAEAVIRRANEPVWGRQYDDRDFFELGRLGRGFQLVDPDPPFDAARHAVPLHVDGSTFAAEPDDAELEAWAGEGRILSTLLFWSGMVRELEAVPRMIDLAATTGLRAGLMLTAPSIELAGPLLAPLAAPVDRGGVFELLEPLLASTGQGVCAEALMPDGTLARTLETARQQASHVLADRLTPTGWWPLLDTSLTRHRRSPVSVRQGRLVVRFNPRGAQPTEAMGPTRKHRDVRSLVGLAVRHSRFGRHFEEKRPFDDARPEQIDEQVPRSVRSAGFGYMWTKAGFGRSSVLFRQDDFVALSLTAGNWDGWSPFYTVGSVKDAKSAERRLLRTKRPGWFAGTIDAPLWALSGEILERGSELTEIARVIAGGGESGRLINVTPRVIARYARLLDARDLLV